MHSADNHFTLLSLPFSYAVDMRELEQAYFALQREHHPDRAAAFSPEEKRRHMQLSVRINDAYRTLQDPLKRAEYMLSLAGVKLGDGGEKPDSVLLMQVMDWREELEETHSAVALTSLAEKAAAAEAECVAQIGKTLAGDDMRAATQFTLRLSYLRKWHDEIRHKLLLARQSENAA